MKKSRSAKIVCILLAVAMCYVFFVSILDTGESRQVTDFNQEYMFMHIEKLSENGPRSLVHKEANDKAVEYIVSCVEEYGAVQGDTIDSPAYMIQDYLATDMTGRYQPFHLQNVVVHIPANSDTRTGDAVMFMGHFDSVPMGQGASDDGVACAAMLEAIRYYTVKMAEGYTIDNDLVFCFVNGEEYNLFGSRAFMNEFTGFDNVVDRIRFGTNLESRGTDGTLIMFETAENNYDTVKLFSEINKNVFTCSIATMVYSTMPNSTDFSNFKDAYQGLNMANIGGGENYHTQNDAPENVGAVYLSQQAQIVDAIIDKLGSYDLEQLYDADESAIFFSYLNIATVVYNHTTAIFLAVFAIVLLLLNIILSAVYRKEKNIGKTLKGILTAIGAMVLSALTAYICYYLFQLIAALSGVIDIHMIGTITYSNTAIVIGIGLLALASSVFAAYLGCKWFKIEGRDLTRGFAYIHAFLGIVLSFVLADASYLFIFSGILLLINEIIVTLAKKADISAYHFELLAIALYFPIVIPVIFLATSALGMTMAYVYGLVFAAAVFPVGVVLVQVFESFSVQNIMDKDGSKGSAPAGGACILAAALIIFLVVSLTPTNASVNLQGKQNIAKLPYDDALVYVLDADGDFEYRIYDLNAYRALKNYAPAMSYSGEYYAGEGEEKNIGLSVLANASENVLEVKKNAADSLVYLDFSNISAESVTVDDGVSTLTYPLANKDTYSIKIHSECTVTVNAGSADIAYKEVLRDYGDLIPAEYARDDEKLHFNLWLTADYTLGN